MTKATLVKRLRQLGATTMVATLGVAITGCFGNDQKLLGAPGIPQPYLAPPEQATSIEPKAPTASRTDLEPLSQTNTDPQIYTPPVERPQIIEDVPPTIPIRRTTPPVQPPLPPPPKSESLTYTVKKGDTLWDIGRMYGVTSKEIAALNNRDVNAILPIGLLLKLPPGAKYVPPEQRPPVKKQEPKPKSEVKPPSKSSGPAPSSDAALDHKYKGTQSVPSDGKYTVRPGDNLWEIAKRFGLSVREIMALNSLKNDKIFPKQTLVLRTGASATREPTTAPPPPPAPDKVEADTANTGRAPKATENEAAAEPVDVTDWQKLPHYCTAEDTLESIAEMYKSEVPWIIKANEKVKSNSDIKEGVKVMVPVRPAD